MAENLGGAPWKGKNRKTGLVVRQQEELNNDHSPLNISVYTERLTRTINQ
jgi:hypothetical protein